MAKKSASSVNKSELIRNIKGENPAFKPIDICDVLKKEHGIVVKPAYVSTILSQAKARELAGKVPGKRGRPRLETLDQGSNVSFDNLLKAKHLVDQVGGVAEAISAIHALTKILASSKI